MFGYTDPTAVSCAVLSTVWTKATRLLRSAAVCAAYTRIFCQTIFRIQRGYENRSESESDSESEGRFRVSVTVSMGVSVRVRVSGGVRG